MLGYRLIHASITSSEALRNHHTFTRLFPTVPRSPAEQVEPEERGPDPVAFIPNYSSLEKAKDTIFNTFWITHRVQYETK